MQYGPYENNYFRLSNSRFENIIAAYRWDMPGAKILEDKIALYSLLRTFESDYDSAQGQLRTISSAWSGGILAATALIAVSLIATPDDAKKIALVLPRQPLLLYVLQIIYIAGSIGIYALWFVDQKVYQRLLHSIYAFGLYDEYRNPAGPQIRSSQWVANLDVTNSLGLFYLAQIGMLVLLSLCVCLLFAGCNSLSDIPIRPFAMKIGLSWIFFGVQIVLTVLVIRSSRKWPFLQNMIRNNYPDLCEAMPTRDAKGHVRDGKYDAWMVRIRGGQAGKPPQAE
jgi:hypothetical protein